MNKDVLKQILEEYVITRDPKPMQLYLESTLEHAKQQLLEQQTIEFSAVESQGNSEGYDSLQQRLLDLGIEDSVEIDEFVPSLSIDSNTENSHTLTFDSRSDADHAQEEQPSLLSNLQLASSNAVDDEASPFGRYKVRKLLGKGGMGAVWQVYDPLFKRDVAMKVVQLRSGQEQIATDDFIAEAQISGQLQHPGIVPVYDMGQLPNGNIFFSMREIEGRTLLQIIHAVHEASKDGIWRPAADGWNFRRLISTFHSVCETIAYAHSRGVVHLDIKPSNIMVGKYGEVLVVDWGIAKILRKALGKAPDDAGQQVQTSASRSIEKDGPSVVGTVVYMSPEQLLGHHHVDERSDIYSLGAVLYQILSGQHAYKGSIETIIGHKKGDDSPSLKAHSEGLKANAQPQKRVVPPLPAELVDICERAMQKTPAHRYQTVVELAAEVRGWLEGAQRREKALAVWEHCQSLEEQVSGFKIQERALWRKSEASFRKNNFRRAWSEWQESLQLRKRMKDLLFEVEQQLQGALIHDPDLVDAHRRLAQLLYQSLIQLNNHQVHRRGDRLQRRLQMHIECLPSDEQLAWQQKQALDERSMSCLAVQRGGFIGRQSVMQDLITALHKQHCISLHGVAGVGKTQISLQVAHQWLQYRPSRMIFCDFRAATDQAGVVKVLGEALGIEVPEEGSLARVQTAIENQGAVLLLLDNVEQVVAVVKKLLHPLLESEQICIILTSRHKLGLNDLIEHKLQPLSLLESIELFQLRAQKLRPDFSVNQHNLDVVIDIIRKLDGLPLAIELSAARVANLQLEEISQRLETRFQFLRGRLREPQQIALQAALDWSWNLLSPSEQSVLVQSSVFRGGFDLAAAEKVIDLSDLVSKPSLLDTLGALCDDNLLHSIEQENGEVRYSMLLSIRDYAAQRCHEAALQGLQHRHASYYAACYRRQNKSLHKQLIRFLSLELDNFIHAVAHGTAEDSFHCCNAVMDILHYKGPMTLGVEVTSTFLSKDGILRAQAGAIRIHRIICLRRSGNHKLARRELEQVMAASEAFCEAASSPTQLREANVLHAQFLLQRGSIEQEQCNYAQATKDYLGALALCQQYEEREVTAEVIKALGIVDELSGHQQRALEYFEQAKEIYTQLQDLQGEARVLNNLGALLKKQGQNGVALQHYKRAQSIYRKIGDVRGEGVVLGNMGEIYFKEGKYNLASVHHKDSLAIHQQSQDQIRQWGALANLGMISCTQGKHDEALAFFKQSLQLSITAGDKRREAITVGEIGSVYLALGEYLEAISNYKKAIQLAQLIGSPINEGTFIGNLGQVYFRLKAWKKATEYLTQAIEICRSISYFLGVGVFQGTLALIYAQQGDVKRALVLIKEAEEYTTVQKYEHGKFLCRKGMIFLLAEQYRVAQDCLKKAQKITEILRVNEASELFLAVQQLRERCEGYNH